MKIEDIIKELKWVKDCGSDPNIIFVFGHGAWITFITKTGDHFTLGIGGASSGFGGEPINTISKLRKFIKNQMKCAEGNFIGSIKQKE